MTEQSSSADSTRRFVRIPFDVDGVLSDRDGDAHHATQLFDISLHGALVAQPEGWKGARGDKCRLDIHLLGDQIVIRIDGKIAHVEQGRIGIEYIELDSESAEHLVRLVELNVGDPDLMHREFVQLVKAYQD